jgi:hypothetical protein
VVPLDLLADELVVVAVESALEADVELVAPVGAVVAVTGAVDAEAVVTDSVAAGAAVAGADAWAELPADWTAMPAKRALETSTLPTAVP